jgi:hypothetical protein
VPGLLASVTAGSDVLFEPEMDALAG